MKFLAMSVFAVISASTAHANVNPKTECRDLRIEGTWMNSSGDIFVIKQRGCDISVTDLKNSLPYEINLSGSEIELNKSFFSVSRSEKITARPAFKFFEQFGISLKTRMTWSSMTNAGEDELDARSSHQFHLETQIRTQYLPIAIDSIRWAVTITYRSGISSITIDRLGKEAVNVSCSADPAIKDLEGVATNIKDIDCELRSKRHLESLRRVL